MMHAKRSCRLRHALKQKHRRHDRVVWKTPLEIRLINRDVLDPRSGAIAVNVDKPFNEKKWISMRQQLEDVGGFRPSKRRFCAVRVHHFAASLVGRRDETAVSTRVVDRRQLPGPKRHHVFRSRRARPPRATRPNKNSFLQLPTTYTH